MPGGTPSIPALSLNERSRRWEALRSAMDELSIDCLVTPAGTGPEGAQSDSGYLTASGSAGANVVCVFPLRKEATAIVGCIERWRPAQGWVGDVREAGASYCTATLDRLGEIPLPHRRIGIVGPRGSLRTPRGTQGWGLLNELEQALPGVEWLDFTDRIHALRMVKSEEEIDLLRHAAFLVDAAFECAAGVARVGVRDYEVWGAAMGALLRGGSDWPVRSRWGAGPRPRLLPRPSHALLQRGYVLLNEIEASVRGYRAQGSQPLAIEDCDRVLKDLYAMYEGYWEGCLERLRVGNTIAEVVQACQTAATRVAPAEGRYASVTGTLALRGEGLAYEGSAPALPTKTTRGENAERGAKRSRSNRNGARAASAGEQMMLSTRLAAGWVVALAPSLQLDVDGRVYRAVWGDTVVLREAGAERLGARPPGLILAGAER